MELEQGPRMHWLKWAREEYQVCTPYGCEGEEEDIDQYLDGTVELKQFAAVLRHNGSEAGGATVFNIYPVYDSLEEAMDRGERDMADDCFAEQPVAVIDLQNGIRWLAVPKVEWQPPEQLK